MLPRAVVTVTVELGDVRTSQTLPLAWGHMYAKQHDEWLRHAQTVTKSAVDAAAIAWATTVPNPTEGK